MFDVDEKSTVLIASIADRSLIDCLLCIINNIIPGTTDRYDDK